MRCRRVIDQFSSLWCDPPNQLAEHLHMLYFLLLCVLFPLGFFDLILFAVSCLSLGDTETNPSCSGTYSRESLGFNIRFTCSQSAVSSSLPVLAVGCDGLGQTFSSGGLPQCRVRISARLDTQHTAAALM